ncbi:hypothetical protein AVEN_36762-1 [Araneus ventricosus]|uniref:Uncharacterized protein n=1 Tax=Araneus ventricosus TaxID=182803 RepID=A0A4Y2QMW0_ARAVE|nr:hypothetical protein AVEN_36762-1 [Araneus ventricosus]
MCRSLRNESADPTPEKERPDPIPTKRNESAESEFVNPWIRIYESAESDLLILRHHDSDSEPLIRIHNLRRRFVRSGMNGTSFGVMDDADKFL